MRDAPDPDVIEVSIFGPGKGESVLVHLGENEWIVVDSCINRRTGAVPVLDYLDRIGVDPAARVRLVVATHAHDDHFAGISAVLDRCESADFVCQTAMVKEQFLALVNMDADMAADVRVSALSEYRRAFEIVQDRTPRGGMPPLKLAIQDRLLLTGTAGTKVLALSPSDQANVRAMGSLAEALSAARTSRKVGRIDPNELAVALWIESADGQAILLGADLLKGPAGCGWGAVLGSFRPAVRASLYKVAHHGSVNAHHDGIWEQLLAEDTVALLAPYRAGRFPVPSPSDVARIDGLAGQAFITAVPEPRMRERSLAVRREVADLGPLVRNVREAGGQPGHVRARSALGQKKWDIECYPPAGPLCAA